MFQGLIQKILKRLFGKFIPDIDSKKLKVGIWSGEVVIQNVHLTKQLFEMLGLPYQLVFSLIQRLVIKIPWRSLSSSPVQISLESMLVLVKALPKHDWKLDDETSVQLILNDINNSIKKYLDQLIQTEKETNNGKVQQKGMLDNIYIRVLDNLQFSIKNIHVRYEDNIDKQYSFGITLDSVEAHTSDKEGQKKFLDRTSKTKEILFKNIRLNNLGFYWREYQSEFLYQTASENIAKRLFETIYKKERKSQIVYSVMINLKGLLKQRNQNDFEGPTYEVEFKVSDLRVKLSKLVVQQLVKFLEFRTDYASHNLTRTKSQLPVGFKQLFRKYYDNYQNKKLNEFFTLQQQTLFLQTILSTRYEKLEDVIEDRVKHSFEKSVLLKMFNKSRSILEKDESDELQQYLNKVYKSKNTAKIPLQYIFFKIKIEFSELSFILEDEYKRNLCSATLCDLVFISDVATNKSTYKFNIKDIKGYGKDDKDIIWKRHNNQQILHIQLVVETVPTDLKLKLGSISFLYDPKTVEGLKKFFQFQAKIDLRNKARDRVQSIKQEVNKNIQKSKQHLKFELVVLPFEVLLPDGSNMWNISLGEVVMFKSDKETVIRINDSKALFKNGKQAQSCIPEFSVQSIIDQEGAIFFKLDKLKLKIDKIQLESLKNVVKMVSSSTNKAEILNKSTKKAVVFLKQNGWKKCLVSICDSYLYFWEKKEYPLGYIRIKKVLYTQGGNKANTIWVGDSNKNHYVMSFEDTQKMSEWLRELQKIAMVESVDNRIQADGVVQEQRLKLKMQLQIKTLQCSILNELGEEWIRGTIMDTLVAVENHTLNTTMKVVIDDFEMFYEQKKILQKKSSLSFLEFESWTISQHNEEYNKIDSGSKIRLARFQFAYIPVCILRILSFIELSTELEEGICDAETMDKQNEERVLSKMDVSLQGSTLLFINKKTEIPIALLQIGQTNITSLQTYYCNTKEGTIENINVFDLTAYPQTIFNPDNSCPQPRLICGSENGRLSFKIKNYQLISRPCHQDQKYNFIDLKVEGIVLHYIHQPVLRIVDYLLVQVLGIVTTPDFFEEYLLTRASSLSKQISADIAEYIKKKQNTLKSKMLNFMGKEKVLKNLNSLKDYNYDIQFLNSKVVIPSEKFNGIVASVEKITILNQFFYSEERVQHHNLKQVLCERYKFQFLNCEFKINEEQSKLVPITSLPFDILITIQMFLKQAEYKFIYEKQIELNNAYGVFIYITPVIINMSKAEYFEIMKCLTMNITHDDGLDFIMIHDYIEDDPVPLIIELSIEHLDLYLEQQSESMVQELKFVYKRSKTLESFLQLTLNSLESRFNQGGIYKQIISKRKNIQKANSSNRASTSFYQKYGGFDNTKKNNDYCLQLSKTQSRLETSIKISTNELAVIFNPAIISFIQDFVRIPEIITPPKMYFRTKTLVSSIIVENHSRSLTVAMHRNFLSFPVPNSDILMNLCVSGAFMTDLRDEYKLMVNYCEIFSCNIEVIGAQDLDMVRRRSLVAPFKLDTNVSLKREKLFVDFTISKTILKFSINDMKSLYVSMNEIKKLSQLNRNSENLDINKIGQHQRQSKQINIIGKTQQFQCLLVNDTNKKYIPILYLNLKSNKGTKISIIQDSVEASIESLRIFAMYFNLKISAWEPVIQKMSLKINLLYTPNQISESNITISNAEGENYLTVDISTSMLQTLLKTVQDVQLALSSKIIQDSEDADNINSWIIYNYTGYQIECSHNTKSVRIQNSQKNELYIKTNKDNIIIDSTMANVYIQMAIPQKKIAFNNLAIGSESVQKLNVNEGGQTYPIYKSIKVDISKNVKYVYFYSPILLINNTTLNLYLQFANFKGIQFPPGSKQAIPYDNIEVKGAIILNEHVSQLFSVTELIQSEVLQIAHTSIKLNTKTKQIIKHICLEPPFIFTNLIPVDLFINIKVKDRFYSLKIKAFDKTASSQTFYDDIDSALFSFYLDGTQILWSQYTSISQGVFNLEDCKSRKFPFNIKATKSNKTTNYILYPVNVLQNRSEQKIVFTNSEKGKLGGQSEKIQTSIIITEKIDYIRIRPANQQTYSNPIKLKQQPTQFYLSIDKNIDGSVIKIFINMVLLCTNISSPLGITYNQFTLFSKYIMHNRTGQELIIRHADAFTSETIMLEDDQHTNMYWFNEQYDKLIRLTMNKKNWEWSGPLNIEKPGTTYFILRDRSLFKKLLHMVLNVVIVNGRNKIWLRVINDESEYPFKIINNSSSVNVYIPSFRQYLSEKQWTYFSWDDPIKQMYTVELVLQHSQQHNSFKERRIYISEKKVKNEMIEIKASKGYIKVIVEIKTLLHQKIITIKDQVEEEQNHNWLTVKITLPIAVAFINNSQQKTFHLLSVYSKTQLLYKHDLISNSKQIEVDLKELQIDNNTKPFVYYPVVLRTNFRATLKGADTWQDAEIHIDKIDLKLEEDFIYECYAIYLMFINLILKEDGNKSSFSISRIKLPKIVAQLEIQTKKLSLETPIELEAPDEISYPWETFPYPIKSLVVSLLSSLSISPISFISSLHEGIVNLFNDTSSSRGMEGFFSKIIGSISNGINGLVRILVGDLERIDNFVDGVELGVAVFFRTTFSSLNPLVEQPTIGGLFKTAANFVYKPITGILRLTLKISEGIKNTAKFSFDDGDVESRKRNPIVFYGKEQCYREYNPQSSEILSLVSKIHNGAYKNNQLVYFTILSDTQIQSVIVVTTQQTIHFSLQNKKVFWIIPFTNIKDVKMREKALQIMLIEENEYFSSKNPVITIANSTVLKQLYYSLINCMKTYK